MAAKKAKYEKDFCYIFRFSRSRDDALGYDSRPGGNR